MTVQPPVLTYATPPELAENPFIWEDRPDGLWVRLPPPSRSNLVRRPIVNLALASMIFAPLAAASYTVVFHDRSSQAATVLAALAATAGVFWVIAIHRLLRVLRRSHEPSVIWLKNGRLFVISPHSRRLSHLVCERCEIIDLVVCPVISLGGESYCRLRVELHRTIAEVDLRSSFRNFAAGLEACLR